MAAVVLRTLGSSDCPEVRPFLKWAGGKRQSLPHLLPAISRLAVCGNYFEPFLGGGALFFEMKRRALLSDKTATLTDINEKLIEGYVQVRDNVGDLIELLSIHEMNHSKTHYYQVRSVVPSSAIARAARLLYLNKVCYNGLFRENSRGEFNVPMGCYKNPCICDAANLRSCSTALAGVSLEARGFERVLLIPKPGDFVYFDPPYHPLTKTSSFTSYSRNGFPEESQLRLADVFAQLASRRVHVLLSNSDTPLIRGLYKDFTVTRIFARRNVNSRGDKRGQIAELLISSF